MTRFERCYNDEQRDLEYVFEYYAVLTATPVDDEGKKPPKRITGYDVLPSHEHDRLTAMMLSEHWHMTPDEILETVSISEFYRRVALVRASSWSQPTRKIINENLAKKRL